MIIYPFSIPICSSWDTKRSARSIRALKHSRTGSDQTKKAWCIIYGTAALRGVLLWNVWEQVPVARALIAEVGPFTRENLKGRLPTKHHAN